MKEFDEPLFMRQLDCLIESLRAIEPSIEVRRLEWCLGLAGDTLVWWFTRPGCRFEVQVEPSLEGLFLIGTNERCGYEEPKTMDEAVTIMKTLLHLDQPTA